MSGAIVIRPIAFVRGGRIEAEDDDWGGHESRIELVPELDPQSLAGLDAFSHAEILFHFHLVDERKVEMTARHPRNNRAWPKVGIFAQRGRSRPNRLGSTIVRVVRVIGRDLIVRELDAIDGTPIVDIKPVMAEFLPREPVEQPDWSRELMRRYWNRPE